MKIRQVFFLGALLLAAFMVSGCNNARAAFGRSENADLVFGGAGTGEGQFLNVRDIAFDSQNNLWVLEANGPAPMSRDAAREGQARLQKFDASGKFVSQFSLGSDIASEKNGGPFRFAIDSKNNIAVTLPNQNIVRLFDGSGNKLRDVEVLGAQAIATQNSGGKERFAIVSWKRERKNRDWVESGGDTITWIDPASGATASTPLSVRVREVSDMASGPNGSLWLVAKTFDAPARSSALQIFGFDGEGKLIRVIGSGLARRATDGSEVFQQLALDSKGNIYTGVGGNPVLIARYSQDGKTVLRHAGQFKFADSWASGSNLPLALDKNDRLWLMATSIRDDATRGKYNFSPAVIRTNAGFFQAGTRGVLISDARTLGLSATVISKAPNDVTYDLAPINADFVVDASNRALQKVRVEWSAYDWRKTLVGQGEFALPLKNGEQAHHAVSFTPPRFGWYTSEWKIFDGADYLMSVAKHFAVTPKYSNMVALDATDTTGGWENVKQQLFAGLPLIRVHLPDTTDAQKLDAWISNLQKEKTFEKDGAVFIVQLRDNAKTFDAADLRPGVEKLKGLVKYIELFNEPNFSFSPAQYAAAAKPVYAMIKEVDPNFRVLGPAVCGIQLPWHEEFFKAGGAQTFDEFSTHDYEGNESITPEHWRWKWAQMKAMLARYGKGDVPLWQTERAISGVRTGAFIGPTQAVRVSLQRDLSQVLGIAPDHNLHYYLNEGGYSKVPSYLWSRNGGPHPGALVLRTRAAMTKDLKYSGEVDFGATGNQMFMGLRFDDASGTRVLELRNLGDLDRDVNLLVSGGANLSVTDSWGNASTLPLENGRAKITLTQVPSFIRLAPNQKVEVEKLDLGRNFAPAAQVAYVSGQSERDINTLVNGVIEAEHGNNPYRGQSWFGEEVSPQSPQTIELHWSTPRAISSVLLRGPRGDNSMCAILDYDLQTQQDNQWKTIYESRTPLPESYEAQTSDAISVQWYLDDNLRLAQFSPVTTDKLRVVVRRVTYGFNADLTGYQLARKVLNNPPPARVQLREIEVYGPRAPVQMSFVDHHLPRNSNDARPEDVALEVTNTTSAAWKGSAKISAPDGWSVTPSTLPVNVAASGKQQLKIQVTPPTRVAIGRALVEARLQGDDGKSVDTDAVSYEYLLPLQMQTSTPSAGSKTLTLNLRDLGTEPLQGTARLEILRGNKVSNVAPVEMPMNPLQPETNGQIVFDVPNLDLSQPNLLARFSVTANGITKILEASLSTRSWLVVGPFENDFDQAFGPEKSVDVKQTFTDMMGNQMKWKTVSSDSAGYVDLSKAFEKNSDASAYAAIWVRSPRAQRVLVSSGADDGGKVWLNNQQVIADAGPHGARPDSDRVEADLKAGWNSVVVKIVQSEGAWGFYFDLLDPQTKAPLRDLEYSTNP